ncbi:MAG: AAA family ATPase [Promicromonosporaceae bacterium]|nr:AAA family ATPase [Promicromonosporaceae bacterium]
MFDRDIHRRWLTLPRELPRVAASFTILTFLSGIVSERIVSLSIQIFLEVTQLMGKFIGRKFELAQLNGLLEDVVSGNLPDAGVALSLKGRRRIGKSRLVSEFIKASGVPSIYFQAARNAAASEELHLLMRDIAESDLPAASRAIDAKPESLTSALRILADALPTDRPSIVVLDELPWLLELFPGGAGELQRVWDTELSQKPVLLILLGSDLSMMESLERPDSAFYGRARTMTLAELNPKDIGSLTGLSGTAAFDAFLITGGQPAVAGTWRHGITPAAFLRDAFTNPTSALVGSGVRVLHSEFREGSNAEAVLTAIGSRGERPWTGVLETSGLSAATLERSLATLSEKRIVTADEPYSMRSAPKDRRWRIADPALRFWLAFVEPGLTEIDRGRPDLAMKRWHEGFAAWRGRAIEPVIRDALARQLPSERFPEARLVGGWWPRSNIPEIDLVAGTGKPARNLAFAGTIKWRERALTRHDVDDLSRQAISIPGFTAATPLVAVSPKGGDDERLSAIWTADDLLNSW